MKKTIIAFLTIASLFAACGGPGDEPMDTSEADSIYTYQYLIKHFTQDPRLCLEQLDTAEMKHMIGPDSCNMLRGYLYYFLDEFEPSKQYLRQVLDKPEIEHTSVLYLETLDNYCALCMKMRDYAECIKNASEGARLAKEVGSERFEAAFYNKAGHAMEEQRPGSGINYMLKAVDKARHSSDVYLLPKASYYLSNVSDNYIQQNMFEEALDVNKQRLELVDEMEQGGLDMPIGFFDSQRGACYCWLALCNQVLGHYADAREAARRFEQTGYATSASGMHGILHYYALTGNRERVTQLSQALKDYFRQRDDTISESYRTVLLQEAIFHRLKGEYRQADEASVQAADIKDSLIVADLNEQNALFEAKFKTQEIRYQLSEKEAEARLHRVVIIALTALLALVAVALWRLFRDKRQLNEKNRELFDTVEQLQRDKEEQKRKWLADEATDEERAHESQELKLFRRICALMDKQQPYTDCSLKREGLARMLGTNSNYVAEAIRKTTDGATVSEFIDEYRLRHAARLLVQSDESIGIIADISGFQSRSHFNSLFRKHFRLTPSEYRKAAASAAEHP